MEDEVLNTAIEKLNELNGIQCTVLRKEIPVGGRKVDAQIQIQYNEYDRTFNVEVKTKIVPAQIVNLLDQLEDLTPYVLVAQYITPKAKVILKDKKIPYLDTAGNIYLHDKGLLLYIETNKTNRTKLATGNRAFNKAGLKVIYQFLVNPGFLNKPYRFIGAKAKVTIDTVRKVIQELLRDKYIIKVDDKEYRFLDRTKLFQDWVTAFNRNLKPKLKQKRYRFLNNENWKKKKLLKNTFWGGAFAAEMMTEYLIADSGIIYTTLPFIEVMKTLKLVPDANGTIQLIETFWENDQDRDIVHPILIYADLINEPNPRYLETANKIYKDYVEAKL